MALSKLKRSLVINLVMVSPIIFIATVIGVSSTWLNPVKSYQHHIGTITHAYGGCPKANSCSFKAVLENGKKTDVSQSFDEERLRIGDIVCVEFGVRKSIDWGHGQLADLRECGK
jgi:hypothetical protein